MLYRFYVIIGTMLYLLFRPLLPLFSRYRGRAGYLLKERFGLYPERGSRFPRLPKGRTIWFHAASVGEVRAAECLITELEQRGVFVFALTVMTEQGHRLAQNLLAGRADCLMASLDIPVTVRRAVERIRPDVFVCVETELWPVLLKEIDRVGVPLCLVNGRLSKRSLARYLWIRKTVRDIVSGFAGIAAISYLDREHFLALGVCDERIMVSGNCKYGDFREKDPLLIEKYRHLFADDSITVFVCGSVRSGEEKLLLSVYEGLKRESSGRLVWIIAPRHIERIPDLQKFFANLNLKTVLLSRCHRGKLMADIILVDSIGELANLYGLGDFNFCGGSLVDYGGHNIMEVTRWGLPVYFGPHMDDFKDAVDIVVPAGAGFQIRDSEHLLRVISLHINDREGYKNACQAAAELSRQGNGSASLQADLVLQVLGDGDR